VRALYRSADRPPLATIVFAPPVGGLHGKLAASFRALQDRLAAYGSDSYAVEFSGQNGTPGHFSVSASCEELREFVRVLNGSSPIVLFGICSGALASLHAARQAPRVKAVFCWEVASSYIYRRGPVRALARRFGIRLDLETALISVQAEDALVDLDATVVLASSSISVATTRADQARLLSICRDGRVVFLDGVEHLPSSDPTSIVRLSDAIVETVAGMVRRTG